MDQLDKRILNLLQQSGRLSIKKMSEQLYVTPPAISQRVKQLEEAGVITEYQAKVEFEKLALAIKAYIHVALQPNQKPEFYPFIEAIPNILECDCVTGPYSMLMKVVFENTRELDQFINELQKFGKTNTQIVFSTPVKERGYRLAE
ncbi:MAG: Lrp/AsnC family transcriptional regulator [Enterococcus sp.]